MNKNKYLISLMSLAIMPMTLSPLSLITSCNQGESAWELTNPDNSLVIDINLSNEGKLTYSVKKDGKQIINTSALGMSFTDGKKIYDFSKGLKFVKTTENEKEFSYDCYSGKTSHVDAHYKEKVITTKIDDLFMDVTFRALNDGYGFQYSFYKEGNQEDTLIWIDEFSEFNIPSEATTYGMDYKANYRDGRGPFYSYETEYSIRSFEEIESSKKVTMPFGYDVNGYYSLINESGLIGSGYHGSFLQKNENDVFKTVHAPACGPDPGLTVQLPFTSPWRVSSVGNYATTFETTIFDDIQGDIDPYLPEGETSPDYYDWVEPGLTAWSWLKFPTSEDDQNYEFQKKYIDLAETMGWKYTLLDATWEENHTIDEQKDLINYAHDKGIKVLVWACAMREFSSQMQMEETLKWYSDIQVDGIKVDFWDGQLWSYSDHQMEDKQTIKQFQDFYELTAKYKLVVNCHGCNKPTGEIRKYPHVINREAIYGNEMWNIHSNQAPITALTRGVVGPSDFTPVVKPLQSGVTVGYQMAMPIILESGIPSMADLPEVYIGTNVDTIYTDFYKHLPASWDKSIFLDGNPQTHIVVARKKGDNWWIAGASPLHRTIKLDLSFLDDGNYNATIYNGQNGEDVVKTSDTFTKDSEKSIDVSDNSGFAIELIKA